MKAFSDLGTEAELLPGKLGRLLVTLRLANGELMGATKRAELESVMADMGEKVETKVGKVNVPDDAPDKALAAQDTAVKLEEVDGETPTEAPGTEEFNGEGALP